MLFYNIPKRKELKKNKKKLPYLLQVQSIQADFQEIIKYFKKNSVQIFLLKKKRYLICRSDQSYVLDKFWQFQTSFGSFELISEFYQF
jgi:hypothetical protein